LLACFLGPPSVGVDLGGGSIPFLPSVNFLQENWNGFLLTAFLATFTSIEMASSSILFP
jgi:hypothetical protein